MTWFEVWVDAGVAPPYLLVLAPFGGRYEVTDPQTGGGRVQAFDTYAAATDWLAEDEYTRVTGRMLDTGEPAAG